jgi:membrane protease subunit HflK
VVFVDSVRQLEVGVAGGNPVLSESLMITGDADESGLAGEAPNIVDVQLLVQYDIKDVEAYLYRVSDPDGQTIKDVTETALRQVIGSRPIDDVLTDKKEDIQAETKLLLQSLLDYYGTGINVREVKLLNVFAPEQVKDAFDDVVRAKEDKARMINLADAYKESILPQARGEAARVTEAAEAYKQERIAIAEGQAERFKAILFEYEKAPEVTRQRLFLEAMEEILPGVKMYIMSGETGSSVLPLLPLTDNGQLPTSLGRSQ